MVIALAGAAILLSCSKKEASLSYSDKLSSIVFVPDYYWEAFPATDVNYYKFADSYCVDCYAEDYEGNGVNIPKGTPYNVYVDPDNSSPTYLSSPGSAFFYLNPSIVNPDDAKWRLLSKSARDVKSGVDNNWSATVKSIKNNAGVAKVEYQINNFENMEFGEDYVNLMSLEASLNGKKVISSDYFAVVPCCMGIVTSFCDFNEVKSFCSNSLLSAISLKSADRVAFSNTYGQLDLDQFLFVSFEDYTRLYPVWLSEFLKLFPELKSEYELIPYTIVGNENSEDYGLKIKPGNVLVFDSEKCRPGQKPVVHVTLRKDDKILLSSFLSLSIN